MMPVKRIEVMVSEPLVQHLVDIFEACRFQAYCISHNHSGRSTTQIGMAGMSQAIVVMVCVPEEAEQLMPALELFIATYGGIFTVVDALGPSSSKGQSAAGS